MILIREHVSITILWLLAPAMFCGLARVCHIISTPGICPLLGLRGMGGNGVVLGKGVQERHFPLTFYSKWSGLVWNKCRWLRPLPFQTRQMKVILLFQEAEGKPAWGEDTWGLGLGPGEDVTAFEDLLCMKDHTRRSLKVPTLPIILWGNSYSLYFSSWKNWDNRWLLCLEVAEGGWIRNLVFQVESAMYILSHMSSQFI